MEQGKLTIVGLGPGAAENLTSGALSALAEADRVILRTEIHPTVEELRRRGIKFTSCDDFYEKGSSFAEVYKEIAEYVAAQVRQDTIVYAVPGSPLVAEETVVLLREVCAEAGIPMTIQPAVSFLDLVYNRLAFDPVDGLRICDAGDQRGCTEAGKCPLVITQVYDKFVAADLKLTLMEYLADEYPVVFLRNLGLPEEEIAEIPLFQLDRQEKIDHLTSVFVPVRGRMDLKPLADIVRILREPGGCPWDIL